MEKDEARLEELSRLKKFEELTSEERLFVLEQLGSEEVFRALRSAESEMSASKLRTSPAPDLKNLGLLKASLRAQSESHVAGWFGFKVPAYATAALMVISSLLTWALSADTRSVPPVSTIVHQVDTIYVASVDTVFRQKIVFRYVARVQPCVEKKTHLSLEGDTEAPASVSMKDNEELDKLLVSGTDY